MKGKYKIQPEVALCGSQYHVVVLPHKAWSPTIMPPAFASEADAEDWMRDRFPEFMRESITQFDQLVNNFRMLLHMVPSRMVHLWRQ